MPRLSRIIGASDIVLAYRDLCCVSVIRYLIESILNGAARIVHQDEFTVERFLQIIEKFNVTYTLTPICKTVQLLNHPLIETANLSSLRHYTSGGMKLPFNVIERMNKYLKNCKLCQSFGLSETAGTIALNLNHLSNDSVGQLISGAEVKIMDEQGDRLGVNESGELCVKLPYMFVGYIPYGSNARKTNECTYFDSEGFFRTGDIARFDENADLFILDRKKEIFESDGNHVFPSEIEVFLNRIDGVRQSCVVPISDTEGDHLPAAVIVRSEKSKCTEESIYNSVLSKKTNEISKIRMKKKRKKKMKKKMYSLIFRSI